MRGRRLCHEGEEAMSQGEDEQRFWLCNRYFSIQAFHKIIF